MKKLIGLLLALASVSAFAQSLPGTFTTLSAATTTGQGTALVLTCTDKTFHAVGTTSAGSGAATIVIEGSNKVSPTAATRVDWVTLGTITLTLGTTQTGDGFASSARWRHVRGYVSAISGTDAAVTAWVGC